MAELRQLLTGLAMGEAPRWHEGRLWLTDMAAREVLAVDLEGRSEVVARVASLGLGFLPDGRLLIVSMMDGRLLRLERDGRRSTHAELSSLDRHPWNDLAVDSRGNAYVNNIGFDFPGGEVGPGTVAAVTPDGAARTVAEDLAFPNGMVVTPDDSTLIVAESYGERLSAFDIAADGGLSGRRVWAALPGGHPDGICLDEEGAVWFADVPARRCVRVREGGDVLQEVQADRGCFSCALGGADGRTLFVVAAEFGPNMAATRTGQVLMAEAPAPGAGWRDGNRPEPGSE